MLTLMQGGMQNCIYTLEKRNGVTVSYLQRNTVQPPAGPEVPSSDLHSLCIA